MCGGCNRVFDYSTQHLDHLVHMRKDLGEDLNTAAQNTMAMANKIIDECLPEPLRYNNSARDLCLVVATAVERLVAMEQCGLG